MKDDLEVLCDEITKQIAIEGKVKLYMLPFPASDRRKVEVESPIAGRFRFQSWGKPIKIIGYQAGLKGPMSVTENTSTVF
jgi:hypothetical protein